ncbi:hypothetical protein [Streptomyces sp. NPDC058678]|uniref:hypothetical protein n=1 Tax=Streptomyces sp. NPDC058678 TaxID=3346595 RepID=UPI0036547A86
MTPNEIQMLLVGIALGAQGMAVTHMVWDMRDVRRSGAASRAVLKRAAGDQFMSSFRLYRLQHRSRA